ncbi:hypothetical protein Tco_0512526 [Tanacetum coccineum]
MSIKCIFIGNLNEMMGYSFYYLPENKVLVARNAEFLENSLITQEARGSLEDLEIIQEEDTHPSIDTSLHHEEDNLEIDKPQSDIILIHRFIRTRNAPNRMCLYIDAEEHELGDLGKPTNYKAALLDIESNKWLSAMNMEMQSMKYNEVWDLVDLPPNGKTVGSKWLFKKKTDMDGAIHTYKAHLLCFAMKDLGEAAYILGIKIYKDRSRRLIGLCQSAYIEKILKRYHMENSKRGSIPMQEKLRLSKSQGASTPAELKRMQNVPYASDVGFIMVSCYTDAGYLTDADDLKSQTGYVFISNGGVVDWKSAKQSIFATSSAEAEYIDAYDASKEAVWVRKFISELGVVPTTKEPINIYYGNTREFTIANESGITKEKVHTYDNLADPFTKALDFPKHSEHTRNIGMLPASSFMQVCDD